jgi:hypothetical protein
MIKRILFILIAIAIVFVALDKLAAQGAVPDQIWRIVEDFWTGINDWLDSVAGISFREIIISIVDIFVAVFEAFIDVIKWLVDRI